MNYQVDQEKKNVYLLGTSSFFNDVSSETIFTLLPLHISSAFSLGILGGIITGLGDVTKVLFGYLSDKTGRRRSMVSLGYFLSSAAKLAVSFVSELFFFIPLLIDRLGKGIRESPRDAIIAVSTRKGWAFGVQKAMDASGAVVGGLLAYLFISLGSGLRLPFIFAGCVGFLSMVPLIFVSVPHFERNIKTFSSTIQEIPASMKRFVMTCGMFGLVLVSPLLFLKTAYDEYGNLGIIFFIIFNIVYATSAFFFGKLSDKTGRSFVLKLSFIGSALSFAMMFMGGWMLLAGFAFYGIAFGSFRSSANALVSETAKQDKGTALGLFNTVLGIAIMVSSVGFGYLLELFSINAYLIGALLSVAIFFLYKITVDRNTGLLDAPAEL